MLRHTYLKKRSFILFEILLALSLVSLTFFMLIYPQYTTAKKEQKLCIESECERIADLCFVEILDRYGEKFDKSDLFKKHKLSPILIELGALKRKVERSYTFQLEKSLENFMPLDILVELEVGEQKKQYLYGVILECDVALHLPS